MNVGQLIHDPLMAGRREAMLHVGTADEARKWLTQEGFAPYVRRPSPLDDPAPHAAAQRAPAAQQERWHRPLPDGYEFWSGLKLMGSFIQTSKDVVVVVQLVGDSYNH